MPSNGRPLEEEEEEEELYRYSNPLCADFGSLMSSFLLLSNGADKPEYAWR
jgi:hypothetical protein